MNDTDFKVEAIARLAPNVGFAYNEKDGIFHWESDIEKPTKDQIEKEALEVKKEYEATQYQRDRQLEYPNLQECIHALLDGGDTLTELQTKRSEIKQKYPKPT